MNPRPTPAERLGNADAYLSRTDLRQLGLERRAVDAVFRHCPVVAFPGYSRPLIRVADASRDADAFALHDRGAVWFRP